MDTETRKVLFTTILIILAVIVAVYVLTSWR